jgi:hypothetical protein
MGRVYYLVAIKDKLEHEKDDKLCIGLDFESDYEEKYEIETDLLTNHYKDCKNLDDLDEKHKHHFCQLCRWYLEPVCYENEHIVLDKFKVVLPSFRGDYFMEEFMYFDGVAHEYCQEGGSVYWITKSSTEHMEATMNEIPPPLRTSEKQQFEQSKRVLEFLKEWVNKEGAKVLFFGEN